MRAKRLFSSAGCPNRRETKTSIACLLFFPLPLLTLPCLRCAVQNLHCQPKIQANVAGVADAVMLDVEGFVSETNATNIFAVRDGGLLTPAAGSCLPGITRYM